MSTITTFLTFPDRAEEAVALYVSLFPRSRIRRTTWYPPGSPMPEGSIMTIEFELDGQPFVALNGGPHFQFSDAISLSIRCETQDEIDRYTDRLVANGGSEGPCGWVRDRFGVSWQVTPARLVELLADPDAARAQRAMTAMRGMKRIDLAALEAAVAG